MEPSVGLKALFLLSTEKPYIPEISVNSPLCFLSEEDAEESVLKSS